MSSDKGHSDPPEKNIVVTRGNDPSPSSNGNVQSSSGSGAGWTFGIGSGGGSGFFSGGFGGSSRRKAKKRAKARKAAIAKHRAEAAANALAIAQQRAQAQAEAQVITEQQRAEAQARAQAEALALADAQRQADYKQLTQTLSRAYELKRAEFDTFYAAKLSTLSLAVEAEIRAAKRAPNSSGEERWSLYLISKEKSEIAGLIARKRSEIQAKNTQANAFNGRNPLVQDLEQYRETLDQFRDDGPAQSQEAHHRWEAAYTAAQEASLLAASIQALDDKTAALTVRYAEQAKRLEDLEAIHEGHRRTEELRQEHIKLKDRVDEDMRRDVLTTANTLHAQVPALATGALIWGQGGVQVAGNAAAGLQTAIVSAVKELGRIAAIRAGQTLSVSLFALLYSTPVGNGELTPDQRRRMFRGIGVPAGGLGLPPNVDLPAVARAGGAVGLGTRIKALPAERGIELKGFTTGGLVPADVPVINATFDPLTDSYRAQTSGPLPQNLVIATAPARPGEVETAGATAVPKLYKNDHQVSDVPAGVDTRINDCIVCFPADSGLAPQYISFATETSGRGVVFGQGAQAASDWWKHTGQGAGALIPVQVGNVYRYREFASIESFDKTTWRAIAADAFLSDHFDNINRKRMARGFAPYAPKSSWVGDRREFEFRLGKAANDAGAFFDLDQLRITQPSSQYGLVRRVPSYAPWPVTNSSTWIPLVPPGAESLGPTELPATQQPPTHYPGATIESGELQNESHPAVDPGEVNASIPGYGEDDDLPSPGLVFAGPPVDPLEVGPYNELSGRSRLDGLDIDHIVSRQALKLHVMQANPGISESRLKEALQKGPSIAIPSEIHRRFSETYGGRNSKDKQSADAKDLRSAVDRNFDAIKIGLLEMGHEDVQIEASRQKLHELNKQQGWYE